MTILITGGAGFIGTKLIENLVKDYNIVVLDNFSEQIHGKNKNFINNVHYIIGDICEKNNWDLAFEYNPDIIIHLAAETGTNQSMDEINRYIETNNKGLGLLLEYLNKHKTNVKKFILASSRAVYGDNINDENNQILYPKSIYGITKLMQEQLCVLSLKIPYTILRFQNVYGDGQSLINPYTGIISIFSGLFNKNEDVTIFDNGKPSRDFIYVLDIVDVIKLCLENEKSNNEIFNVGTGIEIKILDVAEKLKNLLNSNSNIKISDYHRSGDILYAKANVNKIKKYLNWESKYNIDEGLDNFVKWYKKNKNYGSKI